MIPPLSRNDAIASGSTGASPSHCGFVAQTFLFAGSRNFRVPCFQSTARTGDRKVPETRRLESLRYASVVDDLQMHDGARHAGQAVPTVSRRQRNGAGEAAMISASIASNTATDLAPINLRCTHPRGSIRTLVGNSPPLNRLPTALSGSSKTGYFINLVFTICSTLDRIFARSVVRCLWLVA